MNAIYYAICAVLSALVLIGLSMLSKVKSALRGNLLCMAAMAASIIASLAYCNSLSSVPLWASMAVGLIIGLVWAKKVKMIEMPQTVAALNGIGGLASAMVGMLELAADNSTVFGNVTAALALIIGGVTFSGSIIAALKLSRRIDSKPHTIKGHHAISLLLAAAMLVSLILAGTKLRILSLVIAAVSSLAFGVLFAIRVGGADMPVAISLLNSLSGVAGAIAGMAIYNVLLVAVGGIVGSSGLLLTQIMCGAMNRNLMDILLGKTTVRSAEKPAADGAHAAEPAEEPEKEEPDAPMTLAGAKEVIIVPGYGMALSQAQHKVKELADLLEAKGARVRYAIHPVAGRMPGHMNVLLCEADVDYEYLNELEAINDDFGSADAVIVVGANDVMNPAAREAEGTPIYGMPILNVDMAKQVYICNFDLKPGYAGVENPLYTRRHGVRLLMGDAKESLDVLIRELQ